MTLQKKIIKPLISLACIFTISNAFSHDGDNGWVTAQGYALWSNTFEESVIRIIPNDGVYNPADCADADSYFVSTVHAQEVQQRIYSILLSSSFAERSVRIRLDTESCEGNRPKVLHVSVE